MDSIKKLHINLRDTRRDTSCVFTTNESINLADYICGFDVIWIRHQGAPKRILIYKIDKLSIFDGKTVTHYNSPVEFIHALQIWRFNK